MQIINVTWIAPFGVFGYEHKGNEPFSGRNSPPKATALFVASSDRHCRIVGFGRE
jgi:hypothetical protein